MAHTSRLTPEGRAQSQLTAVGSLSHAAALPCGLAPEMNRKSRLIQPAESMTGHPWKEIKSLLIARSGPK